MGVTLQTGERQFSCWPHYRFGKILRSISSAMDGLGEVPASTCGRASSLHGSVPQE
jgi:hypothetical protein